MTTFILNDKIIKTSLPQGGTVLDFVREQQHLKGTKIGCREGDCGACTVLIGRLKDGELTYQSMTSCLTPIINVHGKHVLTVDVLDNGGLTPVQNLMIQNNGTQCGFCTPGFIVSMTGFTMSEDKPSYENGIKAIDGNICRCTGYKSIERSVEELVTVLKKRPDKNKLQWLINEGHLPAFMLSIKDRLADLQEEISRNQSIMDDSRNLYIGGGTDLMVQKPETIEKSKLTSLFDTEPLKVIDFENGICRIGASATVTDFNHNNGVQKMFPNLDEYMKLVSSTPIRNMATIAGNLVNASPIGDMTIFLLALDASISLNYNGNERRIQLKDFYKGYKQLDKNPKEHIVNIQFTNLLEGEKFNFEKVSKRTHLDIASVNSACKLKHHPNGTIIKADISAGGVGPIPNHLSKSSSYLENKKLDSETLQSFFGLVNEEISPIGDARGSADYKRLLIRQLIIAHFVKFFGMTSSIRKFLRHD